MNKSLAWITLSVLSLSLLSGCGRGIDAQYTEYTSDEDETVNVVEMQTFDPISEIFQFQYDTDDWTLEEWPDEEAPNNVVLVNNYYEDGSCNVLPGTIGTGPQENTTVYEGQLLTNNHSARTLEVYTTSGIRLQYVIGYEVDEVPYIFEVNFPLQDQDECEIDAQALVSTFKLVSEAETEASEANPDDLENDGESEDLGENEAEGDASTESDADGDEAASTTTYIWEEKGLSFDYSDGYNILLGSENKLYITTATEFPDGDSMVFWTLLEVDEDTTLTERLETYEQEETFSQETVEVGGRTFTKVDLYATFGGFDYSRYLIELDGVGLIDLKVGPEDVELATVVLESLTVQ